VLTLARSAVGGALSLKPTTVEGVVDLSFATAGSFADHAGAREHVLLEGFTYRSIEPDAVSERLDWLKHNSSMSPQPYEQLARTYRERGNDASARDTAIRKRRQRRKELGAAGKAWDVCLDKGVGYGYRTSRVFVWLAILVAAGTVALSIADSQGRFKLLKDKSQLPAFHALIYTLDTMIPVINLNQRASYSPTGFALVVALLLTLAGWLLVTLLVAALSWLTRRE
jgi:hypothetical protein